MRKHVLAAFAAVLYVPAAYAAIIPVTTNAVDTGGTECRLRDAIVAANNDAATGACPAGSGGDTIELPEDATFAFTTPDNADPFAGANALPTVVGELTIEGRGSTLARSGQCVANGAVEPGEFRFLTSSAILVVRDLSFVGGCGDGLPGSGGAVVSTGPNATFERVVFSSNTANGTGGALSLSTPVPGAGLVTIRDARFESNRGGNGGAIHSNVGLDIARATFVANTATVNGGALAAQAFIFPGGPSATTRIHNTTFSGNTAATVGGAIFVQDAVAALIAFTTFANNAAPQGAALAGSSTPPPFPGFPTSVPSILMRSTWLTDQTGASCAAEGPTTYTLTLEGTNLASDASCDTATVVPAGQLEALANTGGFAPARRPLPGSDGIDAAADCALAGGAGTAGEDQRAFARPVDGDGDGTAACDIGAVELDAGMPPVLTAPASVTTLSDAPVVFGASFGNAITLADGDAGGADVRLELASTNGVASLATVAGLAFEQGDGTADSLMRFTGTLAAINLALDGVAYTPDPGYTGPASLALAANDLGNTGEGVPQSDTATVAITVAVRAAIANLAPASLAFGARAVDAGPSAAQSIVLRNDGNIPLTGIVFKLAPSDYALVHDCGTSLAPGEDCALLVTFDPTTGGSRLGVLAVLSSGTTSPNGVVLTGTGLADLVFSDGYE